VSTTEELLGRESGSGLENREYVIVMFRRNMSPPSSGFKSKQSRKSAWSGWPADALVSGFLLGLLIGPENGGNLFIRNGG
jgi:hypothetical protein